eukprot:COSAG02_NODE_6256_length_3698_cov_6.245902_4_plen_123_part_00
MVSKVDDIPIPMTIQSAQVGCMIRQSHGPRSSCLPNDFGILNSIACSCRIQNSDQEMLQVSTCLPYFSPGKVQGTPVPFATPGEKYPRKLEAFPGTKLDVPRLAAPRGPARGRARANVTSGV